MPNTVTAPAPRLIAVPPLPPQVVAPRGRHGKLVLAVLAIALVPAILLAVGMGPVRMSFPEVVSAFSSRVGLVPLTAVDEANLRVIEFIRLPRVVMALLVGATLATAGACLQGLFRNPLVDPGLIGVSSGAALGAYAVILFGVGAASGLLAHAALPLAAFAGGLAMTFLVVRLAKVSGHGHVSSLLLAGLALNALAGAALGLFSFLSTDAQLRNLTFWSFGSLSGASWSTLAFVAPLMIVSLLGLFRLRASLNALALGEAEAGHLGYRVERLRFAVVAWSALGVGAAVSVTGIIGFVGLLVPHLLRLLVGPDHRNLVFGAALLGGLLLLVADLVARTALMPAELPIGVVTAGVGAPCFVWLLMRRPNMRVAS
jgi:iron complex transport system permease protein